jgi:hypothetical protein
MQKITSILLLLFISGALSACCSGPRKACNTSNSAGDQRMNAEKAQRELSSEVNK